MNKTAAVGAARVSRLLLESCAVALAPRASRTESSRRPSLSADGPRRRDDAALVFVTRPEACRRSRGVLACDTGTSHTMARIGTSLHRSAGAARQVPHYPRGGPASQAIEIVEHGSPSPLRLPFPVSLEDAPELTAFRSHCREGTFTWGSRGTELDLESRAGCSLWDSSLSLSGSRDRLTHRIVLAAASLGRSSRRRPASFSLLRTSSSSAVTRAGIASAHRSAARLRGPTGPTGSRRRRERTGSS